MRAGRFSYIDDCLLSRSDSSPCEAKRVNAPAAPFRFTLKQLLFTIGVFGVLLGLAVMGINGTRGQQRRAHCKNNLRQLALGVSNHQDQRGECPPLAMFDGGLSWAAAILPYVESSSLWVNCNFDQRCDAPANSQTKVLKGDGMFRAYLYCPAKRGAPQRTNGYPAGDYAVPSLGIVESDDPALDDTWMQAHDLSKNRGPFLVTLHKQPQEWKDKPGKHRGDAVRLPSQTSYASWVDGTSNQAIFGEKALHPRYAHAAGKGGDFTVYAWIEKDYNAAGCSRNGAHGLVRDRLARPDRAWSRFGSWHPEVCQFAFGDGHVEAISNYVSSSLIKNASNRCDGERCVLYKTVSPAKAASEKQDAESLATPSPGGTPTHQ